MNKHNKGIIIDILTIELNKEICEYIEKQYGHYETVENVIKNLKEDKYLEEKIIKPIIEQYFEE